MHDLNAVFAELYQTEDDSLRVLARVGGSCSTWVIRSGTSGDSVDRLRSAFLCI